MFFNRLLEHKLSVADFVLSRNNSLRAEVAETEHAAKEAELTETRQKLQKVEGDYRRLAEKYADGEIVISRRAAFFGSIVIPLILAGVIAAIQFGITKLGTPATNAANSPPMQVTKTNIVTITNVVVPTVQSTTNKAP